MLKALILDCEGVLTDCATARLIAANAAFKACGLDTVWDEAVMMRLSQTAGFAAQAAAWFDRFGWPGGEADNTSLIAKLCKVRDAAFIAEVRSGCVSLGDGAGELLQTARDRGFRIAVCGEESARCVTASISLLGLGGSAVVDVALGGEDVEQRKPAPDIYLLAAARLGVEPLACLVVEDTQAGLRAVQAAGMSARLMSASPSTQRVPDGVMAIGSLQEVTTELSSLQSEAA